MGCNRILKTVVRSLPATVVALGIFGSCIEPPLHLPEESPEVELELQVQIDVNVDYDAEWFYGWDDKDKELFGELNYVEPTTFQLRRYFTGDEAYASHQNVLYDVVKGNTYRAQYAWGFWDLLVWNELTTIDGIQSLRFDEETSLDYVTASTGQTMNSTRYQAPKYTRSFYQPEQLYSAYMQGLEINKNLDGFTYDAERKVYVKKINLKLLPLTYIYLTQVIIHHNNGKITGVDGNGNLSGMARTVNMNTGVAGSDAVTVHYYVRFKTGCDMKGESVDIAGGRLVTFGMCNMEASRTDAPSDDEVRHYMDVDFQFNNGTDSTFVFDVTDQVRKKYHGGVLTIELDADTLKMPTRAGGSGFDAVVKDFEDGGTHEFEM